ncbi:MAG TPA: hypothetical protein VFQ67_06685 [Allosphingosinicella sp.]|jgi:hypothetical protein|nr:hypothetical protein [Allosphingosinicella sp.]
MSAGLIRILPLLAWLAACLAAAAPAGALAETGRLADAERARIEALMRRAVGAARKEAAAARSAPGLDSDDRRDAQIQFARLLRHAEGCAAASAFLGERPEILGAGVMLLVSDSLRYGDRECAVALAPLVVERWRDSYYTPAGQISLRFQAGAVLDSAGRPEGRRIMSEAEAALAAHSDTRWDARWHAIDAYAGTPGLQAYLEYLAGRMAAEPRSYSDSKRNGLFTLFAHEGRCDLVERVAKAGPAACDEPKAMARRIYGEPSPALVESARAMASLFGAEEPTLDEQGLHKVMTDPAPWGRVTKLLVFVSYCRWVLDGRPRPGGA